MIANLIATVGAVMLFIIARGVIENVAQRRWHK